jgi:hypothetical protein
MGNGNVHNAAIAPFGGVEPPYGIIWNRIRAGKAVPFLGAGASMVGRAPNESWTYSSHGFLPTGAELSRFLADETEFPLQDVRDRSDLAKVASYYVESSSRTMLRDRLREMLNFDFEPGPLHRFIASVPSFRLVVVTNYDNLMEKAFLDAGRKFDLVIYPTDCKDSENAVLWWPDGAASPKMIPPNELDIDLESTTVLYKMHGSIVRSSAEWDNFVITEEDYVDFLSRMTTNSAIPATLLNYCRERSFLFFGYSLSDWNLRVVLRNLGKYLSPRHAASDTNDPVPHWAIQLRPSDLERILWDKRRVKIFDMSVDDVVTRLQSRMRGA